MNIVFSDINWLAVLVCVVLGQVFLTLWFAVIFADPWAKAYGAQDKQQHTKEIPAYTYGIGLVCMVLLSTGLAIAQQAFAINTVSSGLIFGVFIALFFCVATALPGYAFLRRWHAFILAISAQTVLILILSVVLALWKK